MIMDLLDTNVFIIARFFPRDARHQPSKDCLALSISKDFGVGVFTWLEFCGLASFNVSSVELAQLSMDFDRYYHVQTLYPQFSTSTAEDWCRNIFVPEILDIIHRRMTFADAVIPWIAEQYEVENIITWNVKHFQNRTTIRVLTPSEYLDIVKSEN
jgi:predicted nucleic acid-binding protein